MTTNDAKAKVTDRLREQAGWCGRLGSPLYELLLNRAAADVEAAGPCWTVLAGHENDRHASALALRFMGAVHRLVLEGRAPALAPYYASTGGSAHGPEVWTAFRGAVEDSGDLLRTLVDRAVQTNEVGRSAALVGGFLVVAGATGLPLRILEIGASAGLNLRWDHYRYEAGSACWGDPDSPVRFDHVFIAGRPPFEVRAQVLERAGCDRAPIDPCAPEGRVTLMSYLWPDQTQRLALLRGALSVAERTPVRLATAHAPDWLAAELASARPGVATVVFHSIFAQYLDTEARKRVPQILEDAGRSASARAPLAWLCMEPGTDQADLRLMTWPGAVVQLLARAGFHGQEVRWLAD